MDDMIYFLKHGSKQPVRLAKKTSFKEEYEKEINETIVLMVCFVIFLFLIF
jgi:hypothetical protein